MTIDRDYDLKWDSARAYYYPAEGRANLLLFRGTGLNVQWEEGEMDDIKRATSIRYVDDNNQTVTLGVNKEVVVSAGALRTPLLLEMSGIGNPR